MRFSTIIIFGLAVVGLFVVFRRQVNGVEPPAEFPFDQDQGELFGDGTGLIPTPPPTPLMA